MVATTKNVVGNVNNLSVGDITGVTMLFDMDPPWVIVDNDLIVGVQNGDVKGIPVTPDGDGAFSVELVAVDYPTLDVAPWSITVTITGDTVEIPIVIPIAPPPAAGTGDVTFEELIIPAAIPGNPVIIVGPGGGGGAVDSVNGHTGVVNLTYTDVGGAAAGAAPTAHAASHATAGSDAVSPASIGALTATVGNGLYAALTAGLPVYIWNGTTYVASTVAHKLFEGPAADDPGGSAVDGDMWAQTA